jgi:hypothetical protein
MDRLEIPIAGVSIARIEKMAEILQDQVQKMGVDRNLVTQFFHLFASGVKEREDET